MCMCVNSAAVADYLCLDEEETVEEHDEEQDSTPNDEEAGLEASDEEDQCMYQGYR